MIEKKSNAPGIGLFIQDNGNLAICMQPRLYGERPQYVELTRAQAFLLGADLLVWGQRIGELEDEK